MYLDMRNFKREREREKRRKTKKLIEYKKMSSK